MTSKRLHRNEATWDRVARVILGVLLLALVVAPTPAWGWIGLVGLVPLVTGLVGTCPIYTLLGVGTCPLPP